MNIAYLSTFYPFRGGIAQFNASLYRELEKLEHKVTPYTFRRQYPDLLFPGTSQYVQPDDKADVISSIALLDTINPANYYSSARTIIEDKADTLITKYWMPFFAPSLGTVGKQTKKAGICNIAILDNVIPHEKRFADEKLTNFFLNQYHGFIVMSDTVKDDLLKYKPQAMYEYQEHPLYNHFGDIKDKKSTKEKLGIPEDKKVLLFFGFIRDYKGLDILIKTLRLLDDSYYLLIAGETYGDFDKYSDLIASLNLQDRIGVFNRYISDNEVPDFFSAADVCVLPYKDGTQSGIIGISYNFNLPVIATNVGSLPQMINPYKTGIVIESASPDLLQKAINDYFDNDLSIEFTNNVNSYREQHSWDKVAKAIERLKERFDDERMKKIIFST